MEYKNETTYKGTRILFSDTAEKKRRILDILTDLAKSHGFSEVFLPVIELSHLYSNKAGKEVLSQMFTFYDRSQRNLCLRPEGTATLQEMANSYWKYTKDVKVFYTVECFRYEQPQAGRYRQFTQFGVEWLNPKDPKEAAEAIKQIAIDCASITVNQFKIFDSVKRGLSYYTSEGFEIEVESLGAQKQICGGGSYKEGVGFAFGVDRMLCI